MKRIFGVSLLLLLIVISGCGSNKLTPKATITGVVYENSSSALSIVSDTAAMIVTPLVPSSDGVYQPATVNHTFVDLSNGEFVLNNLPTDRCYLLMITYIRDTDDPAPLTTYIKVSDISQIEQPIKIYPQDWAAGRLTFDLLRNFLDVKMAHDSFVANYDAIYDTIRTGCSNADSSFTSWLNNTSAFYSYLEARSINPAAFSQQLSDMIQTALVDLADEDYDLRFTLEQYHSDAAPNWDDNFDLFSDHDFDEDISDPGEVDLSYVSAARQLKTDESAVIHFRVVLKDDVSLETPADLSLVFRSLDSLAPERTYTLTVGSTTNRVYLVEIPETDLVGLYQDTNGYYLAQVVSSAAINWPTSGYSTSDLDRTPPFLFNLEEN